jgi:hypothetical protein
VAKVSRVVSCAPLDVSMKAVKRVTRQAVRRSVSAVDLRLLLVRQALGAAISGLLQWAPHNPLLSRLRGLELSGRVFSPPFVTLRLHGLGSRVFAEMYLSTSACSIRTDRLIRTTAKARSRSSRRTVGSDTPSNRATSSVRSRRLREGSSSGFIQLLQVGGAAIRHRDAVP